MSRWLGDRVDGLMSLAKDVLDEGLQEVEGATWPTD